MILEALMGVFFFAGVAALLSVPWMLEADGDEQ